MKFDLEKYLNLYLSEAKEHLENISKILEKTDEPFSEEKINALFREAHSLKGMSAAMGYNHISQLAHQMENLIDKIRKNEVTFSKDILSNLLEFSDKLWNYVLEVENKKGKVESTVLENDFEGKYRIEVVFKEGVPSLNARAFLVYKNIESFGNIISSSPDIQEIKKGNLKDKIIVTFKPTKPLGYLEDYLKRVSEIKNYKIEKINENQVLVQDDITNQKEVLVDDKPKLSKFVKVDIDILDYFLNISGELLTIESRIRELTKDLDNIEITNTMNQMEILLKDVQEKIMRLRLTPLEVIFSRVPMWVRDLSRKLNKKVNIKIEGENIELDRSIVESLSDPLLHIIRNALDHGIESPEDRRAKGKDESGKVLISAVKERDRVKISIIDDGRGIDAEKVLESARKSGKFSQEYLNSLKSTKDILYLVTFPGVSTKTEVSDISGRGVGLDVVKAVVESFGGTFEIDSTYGKGTELSLYLPTSISIVNVMFFKLGNFIFGTPVDKIIKVAKVDKSEINSIDDSAYSVLIDYEYLPLYFLREKLHIVGNNFGDDKLSVIVLSIKGTKCGVVVDDFLGHKEVYLRPLKPPLSFIPGFYSSTILGDGMPVLILDIKAFY